MHDEARKLRPHTPHVEYVNALPTWITDDPAWNAPRVTAIRHTLQVMANRGELDDFGNLIVCGGTDLIDASGVKARAFWRHIAWLTDHGFVVVVGRGGKLRIGGRVCANFYAIPASPSREGLTPVQRERRRWIEVDGRRTLAVLDRGSQARFWFADRVCLKDTPSLRDTPSPDNLCLKDTPSVADPPDSVPQSGRNLCLEDTLFQNGMVWGGHGHCADRDSAGLVKTPTHEPGRKWWDGSITDEDLLRDTHLRELWRNAIRAGVVPCTEAHRVWFWSIAEHCIAQAVNPPAMFVHLVSTKSETLGYCTFTEEDRARLRIADCIRDGLLSPEVAEDVSA